MVRPMTPRFSLWLLLFLVSVGVFAPPLDESRYTRYDGGLLDIPDGAILEGSTTKGGIQPDYVLDIHTEAMQRFLENARKLGEPNEDSQVRAVRITRYVREQIQYNKYKSRHYRSLLRQYRESGRNIPLSDYLVCSAGVCREHALLLHLALKAAGIPNKHAYAVVRHGDWIGDHAFTVVEINGRNRIFDAYFHGFNNQDLEKLMARGVQKENRRYQVKKIHSFPRVWIPNNARVVQSQLELGKCQILMIDVGRPVN